jgi:cation/acetate symporter
MAGTLYLTGYGGLAFIMGWTGGYCLVALFLAPYLRKFGQFTIPDFLGARYGGNLPRFIGIVAAILCSFTYVVAQIYGVGLITTRLSGGLRGRHLRRPGRHPGVLVPGRHARRDLDAGGAVHHPDRGLHDPGGVAVGEADRRADPAGHLRLPAGEGHGAEKQLIDDPKEKEVIARSSSSVRRLAAKLKDVPAALAADKAAAEKKVGRPEGRQRPAADIQAAEKALAACPRTKRGQEAWTKAKAAAPTRAKPLAACRATRAVRG